MNIMILVGSYPPIINSAARLYCELAESLSDMGHKVTVITVNPDEMDMVDKNHKYYLDKSSRKYLNGVNVRRISPLFFLSKIPGGKALRFLFSCLLFAFRGVCSNRPNAILVYSPPLYMGISGYIISKIKKTRFVFNMQDIHPKVLFDSEIIKNQLLKRMLLLMEKICYKKAYSFIVYSHGNKTYLLQRGVGGEVFIIPNWVDSTAIRSSDKLGSFRDEKRIGENFIISYAGTIQQAQGIEVVVEAASVLREHTDIIFLIAGDGSSKKPLQGLINELNIRNVLLYPVMPKDRYIQFLSESDVCLVTLSSDIPLQTVPGKLADIMACGRPVIAAVNQKGDAASIIKKAGCGFCVDPGDVKGFSQAVLRMYKDKRLRKEMGENARLFAEKYFSRDVCTRQYEAVLSSAMKDNHASLQNDMG